MENRYPLFKGGRILKKETLWSLRDYIYESMQLSYADYTDGVIKGCHIFVEGDNLVVDKGILKYGTFIYLITEEVRISFTAGNRLTVLKAMFDVDRENPDYFSYRVTFFLDEDTVCKEGQIELCRFYLREGAVLRDTYKDFTDLSTPYDTINLIYSTVSGRIKQRLHPKILLSFADAIKRWETKGPEDTAFCYAIWNAQGEVDQTLVMTYLADKGVDIEDRDWSGEEIFWELSAILDNGGARVYHNEKDRIIYVE